jgi:hypothetical protein
MGELRNKCVRNHPEEWTNVTYEDWYSWINDTANWIYDDNELPLLCGNLTGARHCPDGEFIPFFPFFSRKILYSQ